MPDPRPASSEFETSGAKVPMIIDSLRPSITKGYKDSTVDQELILPLYQSLISPGFHHEFANQNILTGRSLPPPRGNRHSD